MKSKKVKGFYKVVETKNEAHEIGRVYTTSNFDMFNAIKYNRGKDNSIDPKRVADFKKLYDSNLYYKDIIHLIVNRNFEPIDGYNKLKMHRLVGLPINFVITPQAEFNDSSDIIKLGAISRLNGKNSKWDAIANFDTALKCKAPLAIAISEMKARLEKVFGYKKNLLTASRFHALLSENKSGLAGKAQDVEAYDNKNLVEVMFSEKFNKEMEFVCAVLNYMLEWNKNVRNTEITPFFVIRAVMPKVWNNELNMEKFYHLLVKNGIRDVSNKMKSVEEYVEEMYSQKVKPNEPMYKW